MMPLLKDKYNYDVVENNCQVIADTIDNIDYVSGKTSVDINEANASDDEEDNDDNDSAPEEEEN